MVANAESVIEVVPNAAWLPAGGRAEIVRSLVAPAPTGLVRLLLRNGDRVFCERRTETGKLDLPTDRATADDPYGQKVAAALARRVLGKPVTPSPVGFVRNVVPVGSAGYPWPTPVAHFTVWAATGTPTIPGTWIDTITNSALQDRHWWPIIAHQL